MINAFVFKRSLRVFYILYLAKIFNSLILQKPTTLLDKNEHKDVAEPDLRVWIWITVLLWQRDITLKGCHAAYMTVILQNIVLILVE